MKTVNLFLGSMIVMAALAVTTVAAYASTPSSGQEEARHAIARTKHEGYGVLKDINTEAGKIQLAHEAIASLGWPAMTMWFALHGPLPKEVKAGDSVRFELEQTRSKEWVIIHIEHKR